MIYDLISNMNNINQIYLLHSYYYYNHFVTLKFKFISTKFRQYFYQNSNL